MRCLAYISQEARRLTKDDLQDILRVSRVKNTVRQITGVLLYYDGLFMQVIEGEDADVQGLLDTLRSDRRHHNLCVVLDETVPERHFPEWAMALVDFADLPSEDRWLCRTLEQALPQLRSNVLADRIHRLIGSFQAMVGNGKAGRF